MQQAIVVEPVKEDTPSCIMDRFSEMAISDHIVYLEMLIGNQVVRRDERVCLLTGKIFTLPLHFQIALCQRLPGLLAVFAPLLFSGELPMQMFESFLSLAVVARVVHCMTFGVGREARKSHIDANLLACRDMFDHTLRLDGELHVVAIGSTHDTHALDLLGG